MKRWLAISGVLLILLAAGLFWVFSSLDMLVTKAIEKYGSEITQTKVTLHETKISVSTGQGALRGLTVGNPKNFATKSAFELGEISLALDGSTITKPTVVVKEIVIAAPQVTYELGSDGSNIDTIQKNVDSYVKSLTGGGAKSDKEKEKSSEKNGKKLIIEKLIIRDGKVNVSASILKGKTMTVSLPNIQLNDIGKEKNGASPGEVADKIFGALHKKIGEVVNPLDLGQAKKLVESAASGIKDTLEKGASGSKELLDKGVEGVGGAVKGLLGN